MAGRSEDPETAAPECPECGGRELRQLRPDDPAGVPLRPDDATDPHPGVLVCRRCGTIVEWGA